jgi:transcriptional regulator with XRE-family HTH domain
MNTSKLKDLFEKSKDKYADSKAIGTTYQTMYNIIYKNSICKVDLLEKIAKFYKVPIGYFFDEDKKTENENNLLSELNGCKQEIERLKNIIANENKSSHIFLAVPIDDSEFLDLREMKDKVIRILSK